MDKEFAVIQQIDTMDKVACSLNSALAQLNAVTDPMGGKEYYSAVGYLNLALAELAQYHANLLDIMDEEE